jgi:recombination protein RecT
LEVWEVPQQNKTDRTSMNQELQTRMADTSLKGWLQSPQFKEQVAKALPRHMTADRFLRVALTTLLKTPALGQCSKESVFESMLNCSALGLEPDGRRAHLIPYGSKCQLIIDYKGLIELAKRSGEVRTWHAMTVCENDSFNWENGVVKHGIDWRKDRGECQCVYSDVLTKDGEHDYEVMTLAEVNLVRDRNGPKRNGPWTTDYLEMCKKTVIKRHSKRLVLSPEFLEAVEKDEDPALEVSATVTPEAAPSLHPSLTTPERALTDDETPADMQPVKRRGRPPGSKNAAPSETTTAPAPVAPEGNTTPATIILGDMVQKAGFTLGQFQLLGLEMGWLEQSVDNWGQVPQDIAAMLIKPAAKLLENLAKQEGK